MRLHINQTTARYGNVIIHKTFRVSELDASSNNNSCTAQSGTNSNGSLASSENVIFSPQALRSIESDLAIVVPCMEEKRRLIRGVLTGIPNPCLIIIVSNSKKSSFEEERKILTNFCRDNNRRGIIVHQQDCALAQAFLAAGMSTLVQRGRSEGTFKVRSGKGEAMMIGVILAKLAGKQFIGFIDADNFVPGAVHEYCKVFAAGLYYATRCVEHMETGAGISPTQLIPKPYAMVRIKWDSKPKIERGKLVKKDSGRCSIVMNEWTNRLLNEIIGNNTNQNIIETANAGEHAMSVDLAMRLHFATRYAVEPYQFADAWECFSGAFGASHQNSHASDVCPIPRVDSPTMEPLCHPVDTHWEPSPLLRIVQIRTCNPHIHDFSKGDDHIEKMQAEGLSTLYHSHLAPQTFKDDLRKFMNNSLSKIVGAQGKPARPLIYSPLELMDINIFKARVSCHAAAWQIVGHGNPLF